MATVGRRAEYAVSKPLSELFKDDASNTLGAEIARRVGNGVEPKKLVPAH